MLIAKKSLSQNFLLDKNICKKIINQTNVKKKIVLEIGPGYGALTDVILFNNPQKVILVEKDQNLTKILRKKYQTNNKIDIYEKDILNFDLKEFKNLIVISNLPYNTSTKIILYLLNYNKNISEMIFMIQKEVAQKFDYNLPKMNKYKFFTKISSDYSINFNVSNKVFYPKPKVESSVVKFQLKRTEINLNKATYFSNLIFKNVRKRINNNLKLNKSDPLLNKRVGQLSISELLNIYNFF